MLTEAEIARFWSKVQKTEGCWVWTAGKTRDGYGVFDCEGRTQRANRVAWKIVHGSIPNGMHILHGCDNPPCVRPEPGHLYPGTPRRNTQDAKERERLATGDRHGAHTHPESRATGARNGAHTHPEQRPRGGRNGAARLTETQVQEIRARYDAGKKLGRYHPDRPTLKRLAAEYEVHFSLIHLIVTRRHWAHIPPPA